MKHVQHVRGNWVARMTVPTELRDMLGMRELVAPLGGDKKETERQRASGSWILTGSFIGWGEALIRSVDLIVFLYTPAAIRLQRLDRREAVRHGDRILPGGDMHEAHLAFRDWASRYDDPLFSGRNRAQHERWLDNQTAPVLRLQGERTTDELANSDITEYRRLREGAGK